MTTNSAHLHDFKVDKPDLYDEYEGKRFSDIVLVFTTDGVIRTAQYCDDGYFYAEGGETFGNVTHWFDAFPVPHGFRINYARYGGEV